MMIGPFPCFTCQRQAPEPRLLKYMLNNMLAQDFIVKCVAKVQIAG